MAESPQLIVALDTPELDEALALADRLLPEINYFKLGLSLFCAAGPQAITEFKHLGAKVFLDLKLHDIPAQVAGACRVIGAYGVDMVTVHTLGGVEMMRAAKQGLTDGAKEASLEIPVAVGVTVLTSLGAQDLRDLGIKEPSKEETRITGQVSWLVSKLAVLAEGAGLDGVVSSAREIRTIKSEIQEVTDREFSIVTPGIRPLGSSADDQKRITTPERAVRDGANYLVVGRPITSADKPKEAALKILEEMSKAIPG